MKIHPFLLLIAAGACASAPAKAQRASLELTQSCELRDQVAEAMFQSIERSAAHAAQAKPLLDAFNAILAKAKQPDLAIEKQLGASDLQEFQRVNGALAILQVQELVERRRRRDLQVLNRMAALSDTSYRFGIEPEADGKRDDLVYASVRLIGAALSQQALTAGAATDVCNIEAALFQLKAQAAAKVALFDLSKVKSLAEQLKTKYDMKGAVDRAKLDNEDQRVWDAVLKQIVIPSERIRAYLVDLEAIAVAARVSELLYASDSADATASGGDVEQVGASIRRRAEANEFDKAAVAAIGVWRLANENETIH